MSDLREYMLYLSNVPTLEELWSAHTEQMKSYGFDRLIYGFTRFRTQTSLGDPEDFLILTNHSSAYIDGFINKGLYFHAPMLHWALENEGAGSWRLLGEKFDKGRLTREELKVIEFNLAMKVTAGYTISFKSVSARSKGAISLAAGVGLSQEEVDEIWAAAALLGEAIGRLRQKLEGVGVTDKIVAVRGVGFRLEGPAPRPASSTSSSTTSSAADG